MTVYEKVHEFHRLGDSLGLGENALLLLERWSPGLRDRFISIGNKSPLMQIRRWHDGKVLAQQELMDMAGFIGHRGDYHDVFLAAVREQGIPLHMGCNVSSYNDDPTKPSITLSSGTRETADLIIASDGIKSRARELVLGFTDAPKSTGYACFRAFFRAIDVPTLHADPLCAEFTRHDCVNFWIGPDTHLVQNTLHDGQEFNWILTHADTSDVPESWFQPGDMDEVRRLVATVDPRIRAAVDKTPSCLDWKICSRDPLPTWVSRNHRIVLLGDSCHPHLPTSAQGASQATESAAVLAQCLLLALAAGREDANVALATRVYEKLRFPRTRVSQTNGEDLRDRWHSILKGLDDGAEIDPEDVKIRNRHLYGFDAEEDARRRWGEVSEVIKEELRRGRISPLC